MAKFKQLTNEKLSSKKTKKDIGQGLDYWKVTQYLLYKRAFRKGKSYKFLSASWFFNFRAYLKKVFLEPPMKR